MTAGVVVWVTGLPSSGKSTLAEDLLQVLRARGGLACLLDGDQVRESLRPSPGYSAAERADFYETLARLAALLARQKLVVIVAATAHRRAFRERARELAPAFLEVWVDTPPDVCAERDSKGLYAASQVGATRNLPGAGEVYEPPTHPDLVAHGGSDSDVIQRLVERLLSREGYP
jgi:adenylylsulfate kinase